MIFCFLLQNLTGSRGDRHHAIKLREHVRVFTIFYEHHALLISSLLSLLFSSKILTKNKEHYNDWLFRNLAPKYFFPILCYSNMAAPFWRVYVHLHIHTRTCVRAIRRRCTIWYLIFNLSHNYCTHLKTRKISVNVVIFWKIAGIIGQNASREEKVGRLASPHQYGWKC